PGNIQSYSNLINKIVGNPSATGSDIGSFVTGRLGLAPQIGMGLATGKEYIGGPPAKNALASVASTAAPIGISSAIQGLERGAPLQDVLGSVVVGPNLRYGGAPLPAGARGAPVPAPAGRRSAPAPLGRRPTPQRWVARPRLV